MSDITARSKHPAKRWFADVFRVDMAGHMKLASQFSRTESKATKKNHIHKAGSAGAKRKKMFAREPSLIHGYFIDKQKERHNAA